MFKNLFLLNLILSSPLAFAQQGLQLSDMKDCKDITKNVIENTDFEMKSGNGIPILCKDSNNEVYRVVGIKREKKIVDGKKVDVYVGPKLVVATDKDRSFESYPVKGPTLYNPKRDRDLPSCIADGTFGVLDKYCHDDSGQICKIKEKKNGNEKIITSVPLDDKELKKYFGNLYPAQIREIEQYCDNDIETKISYLKKESHPAKRENLEDCKIHFVGDLNTVKAPGVSLACLQVAEASCTAAVENLKKALELNHYSVSHENKSVMEDAEKWVSDRHNQAGHPNCATCTTVGSDQTSGKTGY